MLKCINVFETSISFLVVDFPPLFYLDFYFLIYYVFQILFRGVKYQLFINITARMREDFSRWNKTVSLLIFYFLYLICSLFIDVKSTYTMGVRQEILSETLQSGAN